MVFVKNWPFFHFILSGIVGQENIFYDILERKNSFLCYKNKKFKKSKNWRFFEGVYSLEMLFLALKSFSRLLKQEVHKVEKLTFFQRG